MNLQLGSRILNADIRALKTRNLTNILEDILCNNAQRLEVRAVNVELNILVATGDNIRNKVVRRHINAGARNRLVHLAIQLLADIHGGLFPIVLEAKRHAADMTGEALRTTTR